MVRGKNFDMHGSLITYSPTSDVELVEQGAGNHVVALARHTDGLSNGVVGV